MYRLITKEQRLKAREANFASLIEQGFTRQTYKTLDFFLKDDNQRGRVQYYLQVYRGTGANFLEYCNYTSAERRAEVIANYSSNQDRREAHKAEQKAKGGASSSHASASKMIKEELTKTFPGIKFSVTSDSFSMGDSVDIRYTDGPASRFVEEITSKYQYGKFDGMSDMYEDTNSRDDIPQSKYVHVQRSQSGATRAVLDAFQKEQAERHPGAIDHNLGYIIFQKCSIPAGATVTGVIRTDKDSGLREDLYTLDYEGRQAEAQTVSQETAPAAEPLEVVAGQVQIIEYGRGIAVVGDTRPIKDKLKALGGKFNPRLSVGPGWVFRRDQLQAVEDGLRKPQIVEVNEPAKPTEYFQDRNTVPFMKLLPPSKADEVREEWNKMENFLTISANV